MSANDAKSPNRPLGSLAIEFATSYFEALYFIAIWKVRGRPGREESTRSSFAEFEKRYGADPNGKSKRRDTGSLGRFRKFHIGEIKERDYKLDITWLKDESLEDSDALPEPQDLAAEAITELEAVVDDLREMLTLLEQPASEMPAS